MLANATLEQSVIVSLKTEFFSCKVIDAENNFIFNF